MLFLRLAAYVLWIPSGFAIIAAVILPVVGSRLSRSGRDAATWPQAGCGQVRPRSGPVHVHGTTAPGPHGMLSGRLSASECVWYRERLLRRYMVTRIRYTSDEWMEVDEEFEEQIWARDTGPFRLTDETGSVLVAPALLEHTLNAVGLPVQKVLDEIREEGGESSRYQAGRLGVLLDQGVLPRELLDQFAGPGARTTGYRVCEDILRTGLSLHVFAVSGQLDGQPMMAKRYKDVWTISTEHMPVSLACGGKRAKAWAVRFGIAGVALFAASVLLLIKAGPPG
jgi:hypothetical protein